MADPCGLGTLIDADFAAEALGAPGVYTAGMLRAFRLTFLMIAGVILGGGLFAPGLITSRTRLDGVEMTTIEFGCAIFGAVAGLGFELIFRWAELPSWRNDVRRQLLIVTTLIASIIAGFVALNQWK